MQFIATSKFVKIEKCGVIFGSGNERERESLNALGDASYLYLCQNHEGSLVFASKNPLWKKIHKNGIFHVACVLLLFMLAFLRFDELENEWKLGSRDRILKLATKIQKSKMCMKGM